MPECLKCKSQNVVNHDCERSAVFRPEGLRFLSFTLTQGPQLADEGFACVDCGLVWSSTVPGELATFMRKHCDKTSENRAA